MEQNTTAPTIVKKRRYYPKYLDASFRWRILYGTDDKRILFNDLKSARAFMHRMLDNLDCMGVQIAAEDYYVQA